MPMDNVDELLALLQSDAQAQPDALRRRAHDGPQPLSFAQQRLWFLQRLAPLSTAYNLTRAFLFNGELNIQALRQAFSALVERHGVLRTRFIEIDGEPRQEMLADAAFVLHQRSFPDVAEAARHDHLQGLLGIEDGAAFDLSQAPLLKVELIRYDATCHGLLLKMHHIVSDAWSNPILVADLASAYARRCAAIPAVASAAGAVRRLRAVAA